MNATTSKLAPTDAQIDDMARRLVSQDVRYCVSALVSTLYAVTQATPYDFQREHGLGDNLFPLMSRAPDVADFQDAARHDAGFHVVVTEQDTDAGGRWHWAATDANGDPDEGRAASELQAWRDAFDYVQADLPEGSEVFEHWLVTDDLARRLEEQGESVAHDVQGMTIWGRATTGQAIYADAVFQRIARAILEA